MHDKAWSDAGIANRICMVFNVYLIVTVRFLLLNIIKNTFLAGTTLEKHLPEVDIQMSTSSSRSSQYPLEQLRVACVNV